MTITERRSACHSAKSLYVYEHNSLGPLANSQSPLYYSQCNKGQARAQNFFSPISINLVPKVASNCE